MKTTIKLLVLLFTAGLATGCGGGGGGESGGFEFDESKLNKAQVIHTNDQANFLKYTQTAGKSYYSITSNDLNGFNARGNTNVSTPNKVTLEWGYDVPRGKEVERYDITIGQKQDLSDGFVIRGTSDNELSFYNSYIGDNYFKVTAVFTDGESEDSDIGMFKVEDIAPRNLYVGNMPNCRDMGGRTTVAGGKLRQGLIYRTSGSSFDNRTPSDDEAKQILRDQLRVKTEINVSNNDSNTVSLDGTTVQNCYMVYGSVPYSNLARNSVRVRQIMDILADENNYPVYYHCRIGTDRTGITGMMINGLLGVEFEECLQDYLFSNFAPIDNQRYPGKTPDNNGDDIKKYIDELIALPGATFQEKVYLALRMIGVPAAKLDKIIDIMTIGTKATIPATAKIGQDSDLTSTGTKKTSTDFKTPASYYEVASSNSVSYTATTTEGQKDVIVYIGTTQNVTTSTTKKLSADLSLKIDGTEQTISNTKNIWQAGLGHNTQDNGRDGYMFSILGNYSFTAGSHTIEVGVKGSGVTYHIATVAVVDRA